MGFLYKLDFPNGKSYIGITFKTSISRYAAHRRAATYGKRRTPVYNTWSKYGDPVLKTLAIIEDADLPAAEIRAIVIYNTKYPNGYNLSDGGDGSPGVPCSLEKRIKLRNVNLGKRHSEATCERLKVVCTPPSRKGVKLSREHVEKLRTNNIGRTHSLESRAKIGSYHKNKIVSPESIAKTAMSKVIRFAIDNDIKFTFVPWMMTETDVRYIDMLIARAGNVLIDEPVSNV